MARRKETTPSTNNQAPSINVSLRTNRKAAEAFRLQIERLARRLGIPGVVARVRRVDDVRR